MSIASRQAAGWVSKAAWYYEHGYSIQQLYDAWGGYAPGEDSRTLNAIWRQGELSAAGGALATGANAGGNVPLGYIPGRTGAAAQFRYGVLATFSPSNGLADQPIYFTVTSPFQLSLSQLRTEANNNTPTQTAARRGGRSYGPADITWTLSGVEVLSIERV